MIFRWILFALIFLLARRLVLSMLGKRRRDGDRVGAQRPRARDERAEQQTRTQREKDLAAGQRIEEADYEELD